jgi:hypothetical protein
MKTLIIIIMVSIIGCEKDNSIEKNAPATGTALFYSDDYQHRWSLKLDGVDYGSIAQSHSEPECGNSYFQNLNLTSGTHTIEIISLSGLANQAPRNISIIGGSCNKFNIR